MRATLALNGEKTATMAKLIMIKKRGKKPQVTACKAKWMLDGILCVNGLTQDYLKSPVSVQGADSKKRQRERATGDVLQKHLFLKISQCSQENTWVGVSFLIKV